MTQGRWSCREDGAAGKMELQGRWSCREDGAAGKMELQGRWSCREDGAAGKMELQGRWSCRKDGAARTDNAKEASIKKFEIKIRKLYHRKTKEVDMDEKDAVRWSVSIHCTSEESWPSSDFPSKL